MHSYHLPLLYLNPFFHFPFYFSNLPVTFSFSQLSSSSCPLLCLSRKMVLQADRPPWCLWWSLYLCRCTRVKRILWVAGLRDGSAWVSGPQDCLIANLPSLWPDGDHSGRARVLARLVFISRWHLHCFDCWIIIDVLSVNVETVDLGWPVITLSAS